MTTISSSTVLDEGSLSFSIESRILRELGERLVKQPEVAIVELVKNAYDADARECTIVYDPSIKIQVIDTGNGMTLEEFINGWMRIGTSSKESTYLSPKYRRKITGEKGIGRFAVRFLGRQLHLESVADDPIRKLRTKLTADFDWPRFDRNEDLGSLTIPYRLQRVDTNTPTGTTLVISRLRGQVASLDLKKVRNGSLNILTPLRSLFRQISNGGDPESVFNERSDPGFLLSVQDDEGDFDIAAAILDNFILKAQLQIQGDRVSLQVFRRGYREPYLELTDTYPNFVGNVYADIRFFPRRGGVFTGMPVDGRKAYSWVVENSGVAVFDRSFRVLPYGEPSDDWLKLQLDSARNRREPRSPLANKHFAMSPEVRSSTSLNWMLRLPQSIQLIGIVQVEALRHEDVSSENDDYEGLVASADREGFVLNTAYKQLRNLVRGAVEAIAYADRQLQQEEEYAKKEQILSSLREQTQLAISEIEANPSIAASDKTRIVSALAMTQQMAVRHEEISREREQQLEVMSLLGVVAGFMTHEFGVALQELQTTHKDLAALAKDEPRFGSVVSTFEQHISRLKEFVTYSSGYIQGTKNKPSRPYPVRPRLLQVKRIFGRYAEERNITVEISAEPELLAPLVPVSLYNGIALNLYTNALKAVIAKVGSDEGLIAFRAWNDNRWHYLEVSDTGIGIPSMLKERIFDPLFTTTASQKSPLGSGMGLGLALVRRGAEAFGGRAEAVDPPPNFATCIQVKLPIEE